MCLWPSLWISSRISKIISFLKASEFAEEREIFYCWRCKVSVCGHCWVCSSFSKLLRPTMIRSWHSHGVTQYTCAAGQKCIEEFPVMAFDNSSVWWEGISPSSGIWDTARIAVSRRVPVWEKTGQCWAEKGVWWPRFYGQRQWINSQPGEWEIKLGHGGGNRDWPEKQWELAGSSRKDRFSKELDIWTADIDLPT